MAQTPIVLTSATVTFAGTDLSPVCKSVKLTLSADDVETTTFGSSGSKTRVGGLKDGSVSIKLNADYVSSSTVAVDSLLWSNFGSVVACKVKATSSANSTSNPEYQFNVLVNDFTPITGGVGDLGEVEVTFPISGAVTRATS